MSWPFAVLGLEAGADATAIKRAYAARLKQTRPDEDPEGFQALNDAYRACLASTGQAPATQPPRRASASADAALPALPAAEDADASVEAFVPHGGHDDAGLDEPRLDHDEFLDQMYALAQEGHAPALHRWLQARPDIYSLSEQRQLTQALIETLEARPSLTPATLNVALSHFELDDGPWASALAARAHLLRERADIEHPGFQNLQFRSSARERNAPGRANYIWLVVVIIAALNLLRRCTEGAG